MYNNNRNHKTARTFLLASIILGVSGCASTGGSTMAVDKPKLDSIKYLEEIAVEARHELRLLAKMQEAQAMETMTDEQHAERSRQALMVPRGFEKRVDLDVEGTSESVAEAIALMAGYKFEIVGDSDGNDIYVDIKQTNKPLHEALRELGAQTGDLARAVVDQNNSVMLYTYKSRRNLSDMPSKWRQ